MVPLKLATEAATELESSNLIWEYSDKKVETYTVD